VWGPDDNLGTYDGLAGAGNVRRLSSLLFPRTGSLSRAERGLPRIVQPAVG
jgi:hypothetical protein